MKRLLCILIISSLLISCSKSVAVTNISKIESGFKQIKVGMNLIEVKHKLGKESFIFSDGTKEHYVWSSFEKGEDAYIITIENEKVISKEIDKATASK